MGFAFLPWLQLGEYIQSEKMKIDEQFVTKKLLNLS